MIAIDKTLVSEDLLDKKFVCDLNACKGACCVAGDSGAPLNKDELPILEELVDKVKPYMVKKGIKAVEKYGPFVVDSDGDYTTTLVSEGAECAFVYFDETKTAKCAIEKAYYEGVITWKKPISCHLYPIRITEHKNYDAVNYDKWDICKPACECGKKLDVPVYKFLKEPLIRKYGKEWFKQLEKSAMLHLKKD
ncbi:DUF3109 family protein [Aurantibacillus circumpalustris]|uniref:DUF3109 family protein n=1 Tax=Aurantibacillus circumpalustris TaxID=3036359 RepID=UPI00295C38F2|nr:DUF3109 family protein [Aurantibacillus circumpalustris]